MGAKDSRSVRTFCRPSQPILRLCFPITNLTSSTGFREIVGFGVGGGVGDNVGSPKRRPSILASHGLEKVFVVHIHIFITIIWIVDIVSFS